MVTETRPFPRSRRALAISALAAALVLTLLISPQARAAAAELGRQIGAFFLVPADTARPETRATAVAPGALDSQRATDVAEAGEMAGFTLLTPAALPAGYTLDTPWVIFPQGEGMLAGIRYANSAGNFIQFDQYRAGPNDLIQQPVVQGRDVEVRGQPGVWINGRQIQDSSSATPTVTNWLMWEEDGVNYTIYSDALSLEESLALAESLAP